MPGNIANYSLNDIASDIRGASDINMGSYKNTNFYSYTLDRPLAPSFLNDGGFDMYDNGAYTQLYMDATLSPASVLGNENGLLYTQTTATTASVNGKTVEWVSFGYIHPLIVLAKSSATGNFGLSHTGDAGADGGGSNAIDNLWSGGGQAINGYTVYGSRRIIYNAGDPSICDVYFFVTDSSSTLPVSPAVTTTTTNPTTAKSDSIAYMSNIANVLAGSVLLSDRTVANRFISIAECETVVANIVNNMRNNIIQLNTSSQTVTTSGTIDISLSSNPTSSTTVNITSDTNHLHISSSNLSLTDTTPQRITVVRDIPSIADVGSAGMWGILSIMMGAPSTATITIAYNSGDSNFSFASATHVVTIEPIPVETRPFINWYDVHV